MSSKKKKSKSPTFVKAVRDVLNGTHEVRAKKDSTKTPKKDSTKTVKKKSKNSKN